ncbi:uncharacterized protein LOC107644607 isoform X1 [Arachis ipaensis]|uniref:uncharacterized protein LOC107644607 isoform X1 n=2 Tax=Arachis ipaensis TaxID=130454 RepID=UPI0007AF6F67|nr:uncharacterized protein LOC107644607 isoform X1 [Arachis ipaensis]
MKNVNCSQNQFFFGFFNFSCGASLHFIGEYTLLATELRDCVGVSALKAEDTTGDWLIKKRVVEAWKNKNNKATKLSIPFAKSLMARKMHCNLQEIEKDSPKVSEVRKDSTSTLPQQQNKTSSFEDCGDSSVSSISTDSGCAVLTFLNFEPDGNWRIVAIPVRCLSHINLASSLHMDGLQLLLPPPPIDRLKIDQCKGPRSPLPHYAYSVKSFTRRNDNGSNVRRRCQNKIAKKAAQLNELNDVLGNSHSQSSLVCSSALFPDSSAAVNSSDKLMSITKEDKSLKKNSRKRLSKKIRQSKKKSSDSGSAEQEVPSLASETCSSNDMDKEAALMTYTAELEISSSDDRLVKDDCERSEMNGSTGVPESYKTFIDDIVDSLVLDSVSVGSHSDASTKDGETGIQSSKGGCGVASNSGDGYFPGQNVTNGVRDNCERNEGIRNGGQNFAPNDKRAKQKRTVSKSSSFNKFGNVGVSHGRPGKENSHSIWQKVQKKGSEECSGDSKKVNTTLSQSDSTVKKDPPIVQKPSSSSVNVTLKTDDKNPVKNKVDRKTKVKMDSTSRKGLGSYSRKGSHFDRSTLNDDATVCSQQNDMSHVSYQENNQQRLTSVSGLSSDTNCVTDGFQTNRVEQITSELVHSSESESPKKACNDIASMNTENIDIQDSSLATPCEDSDQLNMSNEQSSISCNPLGDEADQREKEVSHADYNAQSHSSGTSGLWKWIPIGKKDTGLTKSESSSSSPEHSDAPHSKNINLDSNVEPQVASTSQNQDSSLNASRTGTGQVYSNFGGLVEGENQALGNQVACTVIENSVNHDAANQMVYECENQETLDNDSYRIAQAVNDACGAQLACEALHMATGDPIAEIERLLHFCSPVICQSSNSPGCFTCAQNSVGCVSLCRHDIPDVSLGCLWQWYEKHGSYGLEIRGQDYENPKKLGGIGNSMFRAYFVPSLSAVQLFKNHENQLANGDDEFPFITSTCYSDLELLYEYFELEQPQQRRPLYDKIQELVGGDTPMLAQIYGDPSKLESINLRDLHPRSWYSVAWYPIYRIPDGNFRAAFLTYHSLGHLVRRSRNPDSPTVGSCIVSPAVGLQSYNAQGECWFQLRQSALAAEMLGLNPSILLKERLRTLEETASLMAKAVVNKDNKICANRHPDYEFFLSRRRY